MIGILEKGMQKMARKTIWYCDRCKKEFKRDGFTHSVEIPRQISFLFYDGLRCFATNEYELCNDCSKEFLFFLGGRKLEDGK